MAAVSYSRFLRGWPGTAGVPRRAPPRNRTLRAGRRPRNGTPPPPAPSQEPRALLRPPPRNRAPPRTDRRGARQ
ncbi:hypothetical protein CP978_12950 [Streptomyces nodosus]|uniref:Uncharacterized protein n=1 Tax=Streptomyces nodosus TaxID=40318 RepID=A0A5P2W4V3_9ACTN|nr:hypothetical protein CP978_12950 [Streptomyces nodosus]